jgi:ubiquinone/menaquinone biosynthesis C-methylase UbiE
MARHGEYGDIVSPSGEIALTPELQIEADFFIAHLRGRSCVVDVGCGMGFPSLVLSPHVGYLVALDAAPGMLSRLRSHVRRLRYANMGIVRGRAAALPLAGEQFDGAAICGTLGSVAEPNRLLSELRRVMQPGGLVSCVAENFAHKLVADEGKDFRWFRMMEGQLSLQVIEYLRDPYRMRDYRYIIRENCELYRVLRAEHEGSLCWREETRKKPENLPPEIIAEVLYDEAMMFDPATLEEAFESAGFSLLSLELRRHFPVEHIFSTFDRA